MLEYLVMKLPNLPARKILPILYKLGFYKRDKKGSHLILKRDKDSALVTIPIHSGKDIPRGTLFSIIKQAGLTKKEFLKFLKKRKKT